MSSGLIDWHSHMLSDRLTPPAGASGRWPGVRTGEDGVELTLGGSWYRAIDARTFDPVPRLVDMDAQGVATQVLSPPPYAVAFEGPPYEFAVLARQQNAFLADVVAERPDRFAMLGMLPFGTPAAVDAELDRLEATPGVVGVCLTAYRDDAICSSAHVALWSRIAANGWVVFVHPADTAMCSCDTEAGAIFGMGMPLATARTATTLVLSGLPSVVPGMRVLLAHAGGAFTSTVHRLEHGWRTGQHQDLTDSPLTLARRCFWVDTLAYAAAPLRLATETFGADRIVFGSDYPFVVAMTPADLAACDPDAVAMATRNGVLLSSFRSERV